MTDNPSPRPLFRWWALALIALLSLPAAWLVFIAEGWTVNRLVVRIWSIARQFWPPMRPDDMDAILNTALFVPLGLLAALWAPRVLWWVWGLIGLAGSVSIELLQYLFLPRDASGWDVFFNTLGAFLGAAIGEGINRAIIWARGRAAQPRSTQPEA
ncbi:MAG: VanZ family protein [Propionibacteriaceae bacterium]|nr:VanZ family protein [Propionibacteriaceae bacterium]